MNSLWTLLPCLGSSRTCAVRFAPVADLPVPCLVFICVEGALNQGASARCQAASRERLFGTQAEARSHLPTGCSGQRVLGPRGGSGPGVLYHQLCLKQTVLEGMPLPRPRGNSVQYRIKI
ncbi:unnamed protein product [Pipistrellus nathusii]|uniref:Uncharacterized protein n=1 Tax=Pipistrellus nathusii TaxID=59473 RepID=A0ABN9ZGX7_PIPNA